MFKEVTWGIYTECFGFENKIIPTTTTTTTSSFVMESESHSVMSDSLQPDGL